MPVSSGGQPPEPAEAIKYGWAKFQQHWQVIVVALVVGFVAMAILVVIGIVIQGSLTDTSDCTVKITGNGFQKSGCDVSIFTQLAATGITNVMFFLGQSILNYFIIRATLSIVKGEKLDAAHVMNFDKFGPYIVTALLAGLLTFLGIFACFVGALVVAFFVMFWGYFVIDKDMAPFEAIKASFNLVKDNIGVVLVFWLLTIVVTIAGAIACGVGLIVAIPVVTIATGYMYKRLQGEPVAA